MQKVRKLKVVTIVAIAFGIVSGLSACNKSSGGGVMAVDGDKKATFGYQLSCEDVLVSTEPEEYRAHVTGNFQFKDRNGFTDINGDYHKSVSFHGRIDSDRVPQAEVDIVDSFGEFTCDGLGQLMQENPFFGDQLQFTLLSYGTYTPQPKKLGLGGDFRINLTDSSSVIADPTSGNGCTTDDGDFLNVEVLTGVYAGYNQGGCVDKGNISHFTE